MSFNEMLIAQRAWINSQPFSVLNDTPEVVTFDDSASVANAFYQKLGNYICMYPLLPPFAQTSPLPTCKKGSSIANFRG